MKKLSDYKGDEAIELWADLLEPMTAILSDKTITTGIKGKSPMIIARDVLKGHKQEAVEILTRIDPTPLDGMNILTRLVALLYDMWNNEEIRGFFGFAPTVKEESESSGSATVNTEDGVK